MWTSEVAFFTIRRLILSWPVRGANSIKSRSRPPTAHSAGTARGARWDWAWVRSVGLTSSLVLRSDVNRARRASATPTWRICWPASLAPFVIPMRRRCACARRPRTPSVVTVWKGASLATQARGANWGDRAATQARLSANWEGVDDLTSLPLVSVCCPWPCKLDESRGKIPSRVQALIFFCTPPPSPLLHLHYPRRPRGGSWDRGETGAGG